MASPTFLGIGAMKAATTTVAEYLALHPEVHIPAAKELFWFDPRSARHTAMSQAAYEALFDDHHAARGEFCTTYQSPWVLLRIAQVYPKLKLILNVRPPVARLCSALRHLQSKPPAGQTSDDFAIERIIARYEQRGFDYQIMLGDYRTAIVAARSMGFDVHVISFHDVETRQQDVWVTLTQFLGVSYYDPGRWLHAHQSDQAGYQPYGIPPAYLPRLDAIYQESNQFMLTNFGVDLFRGSTASQL